MLWHALAPRVVSLLQLTEVSDGTRQDVDAAWGDAGLGDLDDWSKFLEVPDLDFLPDDAVNDIFGSAGGASQPADRYISAFCFLHNLKSWRS